MNRCGRFHRGWLPALAGRGSVAVAPAAALLGSLVSGAVLLLLAGHDPVAAYAALLRGAGLDPASLGATIGRATPIVGLGLAAAVAFRAGFFNLGAEGQMVLGGLAATLTALYVPAPAPAILSLAAGALAGAAYGALAAVLDARFRVPLLVGTLLLNYPARFLASYLVNHPFRDVAAGLPQSFRIPEAAALPVILPALRVHAGMLLVLAATLAAAVLLARTRSGYRARMAGLNAGFARCGGVDVPRLGQRVLFLSGALAGLVGGIEVLAVHRRFIDDALTSPLYAWTGLMAALLAGGRPLGVLGTGLVFAALQTGGFAMERQTEVPRELSRVLQALVLLLVAVRLRSRAGAWAAGGGER